MTTPPDLLPNEIWVRRAQCGRKSRGERLSATENNNSGDRVLYTRAIPPQPSAEKALANICYHVDILRYAEEQRMFSKAEMLALLANVYQAEVDAQQALQSRSGE